MEETNIETPQRPQFLTVLCILTFIGVGLTILMSLFGWWGMNYLKTMMEQNGGDLDGLPGMDPEKIEETMVMMQHSDIIFTAGIIGCIICLIGALQMWKLKKTGFYIYAIGEITPAIVSVSLMGSMAFSGWNSIGYFVPVIFLVLYGLNFKHLK